MKDINRIIAAILTSESVENLKGGVNDEAPVQTNIFGVSGGSIFDETPQTTAEIPSESIFGGKKRLPPRLKRWNKALLEARRELGITGFVPVKKNAPTRSPSKQLYDLTRKIFDR